MAMLRAVAAASFLLLLASGARALDAPRVEPPDPDSKRPVTLVVQEVDSCAPDPVVRRNGFVISVELGTGPCLVPPSLLTHRVGLGVLPAGTYAVLVSDPGAPPQQGSFTVRDSNDSIVAEPWLVPSEGGTHVVLQADRDVCQPVGDVPEQSCPGLVVTIDGVPVSDVVRLRSDRLQITTPPHPSGVVEIELRNGDVIRRSYALRYFSRAEAPLPDLFERMLIPVLFRGPGAGGSQWTTDVALTNLNRFPVELWNSVGGSSALPRGTTAVVPEQRPEGLFIVTPRGTAARIRAGANVRETSAEPIGWGAELPIAREDDFSPVVHLPNVPRDSRYRRQLRIYSLEGHSSFVDVQVYTAPEGTWLGRVMVLLTGNAGCAPRQACASDRPPFASIDLDSRFRALAGSGRVRIEIGGGSPLWAFVTVTNNETQHVTVISPQ